MRKHSLPELIEYDEKKFRAKVLINEPGYRMVLLALRAGQSVPEHANPGIVTVHCIAGRITFYEKSAPCELRAGDVLSIEAGAPHRLEAHEDSALLVLATGNAETRKREPEELDVREIPRPERHPLVFAKLDALAMGEIFGLLNDHDPIPLSKQIESLRPGQFTWKYVERGPLFRVRIERIAPGTPGDAPLRAPSAAIGIDRA